MKIGIDIGGSHIAVGIVKDNGTILDKIENDVKDKNNIEQFIFTNIQNNISALLEKNKINKIESIGIAYPASLRNGKIGMSLNVGLEGEKIKRKLQEIYKEIPVYMRNDAKCAALAEKYFGVLQPYKNALFLTIGTGIGGAVFLNNKLLVTPAYDLLKVGHMTINKDGEKCKCGKRGCFESYASIKALKNKIIQEYNLNKDETGINIHEFIEKNLNDKKMNQIIDLYSDDLITGISNLINLFEPEAIGFGGSFAYYEDIFLDKLKEKLNIYKDVFNDNVPELLIAKNKNDAGMIGATVNI